MLRQEKETINHLTSIGEYMRIPVLPAAFLGLFAFAQNAHAADYAIAQFQVNGSNSYQYLKNAVPPMFNTRLFAAGMNEPVPTQDSLANSASPKSQKEAQELRKKHKADYLVYGTVSVIGDTASLDVSVVGDNNYFWQKSSQNNVNNLLAGINAVAGNINQEVFKTSGAASAQARSTAQGSSFINAETGAPSTNYLNPELRYQGVEENKFRSQTQPFESTGMQVADFNGNGFNEILLGSENEVIIYSYNDNQLKELARKKLYSSANILRISTFPHKGRNYIVVATCDETNNDARSYILLFNGKQIQEIANTRYYLNVAKTSAHGDPELIGQNADATRFVKGAVFRINFDGKNISKGTNLSSLPSKADVFNFTYVPSSQDSGDVIAVIDDQDRLNIFSTSGKLLSKTEEYYASTANRVSVTRDIGGFVSQEGKIDASYHYVPSAVNVVDIDNDNNYELIVTKPLSVAANLLNNYRNYAQSEVHALLWDGVGANLLWKTRRIKGTVADVKIADPNNDGVLDLVVNVNTYPGTMGISKIRTFVTLYPLDTNNINTDAINFAE